MKKTLLALTAALFLAQGLYAGQRGEHRISATRKMQIVYLDAQYALMKGPWRNTYAICEAKYAGPPEVAEFTGDIPGKDLVQDVTALHLLEHAAIGVGFDPGDKGPPQHWLYFISNLETGHTSFFRSKTSYHSALSHRFGVKEYPVLLPPEKVMKNLERAFDSKRGPEAHSR